MALLPRQVWLAMSAGVLEAYWAGIVLQPIAALATAGQLCAVCNRRRCMLQKLSIVLVMAARAKVAATESG